MGFPTSGETASFSRWLRLSSIRDLVVAERPDLAAAVQVRETAPLALTVDLPVAPSGHDRRVVLAQAPGHWHIAGPRVLDILVFAWDLDTGDEQLRDALLATYEACVTNTDVASPWRWAEPERTVAVRIADVLADAGTQVEAVVSANRP